MIKFAGMLKDDCSYYLMKKQKLSAIIKFIVMFILLSLPVLFVSLIFNYYLLLGLIFILLITILDIMLDKSFKTLPNQIIIDDYSMEAKSDKYNLSIKLSDIVYVIDMGTWYSFKFNYKINNFFVCQKDLLIEGSIEEFEKLFEGKIKRLSDEK